MKISRKRGNWGLARLLLLAAAALGAAILLPRSAAALSERVLYSFGGSPDGANPDGPLLMDGAGNLNGTTVSGGNSAICVDGCGTVVRLAPDGTETVLAAFARCSIVPMANSP